MLLTFHVCELPELYNILQVHITEFKLKSSASSILHRKFNLWNSFEAAFTVQSFFADQLESEASLLAEQRHRKTEMKLSLSI
jgi:hypothetical protein